MGKMTTLQSSLSGGELSPKLKGRPELPRYQSGLEWVENFILFVLGGATNRPGTRRIQPAFTDDGGYALDSYTSLDDDGIYRGFCIESNANLVRVFKAGTVVAAFDNLDQVDLERRQKAQHDGYLYVVSPTVAPSRIKRNTDADWDLEVVPFVAQPMMRPPNTKAITITPSAVAGDITLTASADFFEEGHVGVKFTVNRGTVEVTAVTDATHAEASVVDSMVSGDSVLLGTTRFDVRIENAAFFDSEGVPLTDPDTGNPITHVDLKIHSDANFVAKTQTNYWDPIPESVLIVPHTATSLVSGTEPDPDWREQAWSDLRGWPVSIDFYDQRMILAGSRTYPATVWGSKPGEILDFTLGTGDSDAFALPLAAADTPIRSIAATDRIYIFTANKDLVLDTGNEKPLTPTNFRIKERAAQGASFMPPVRSGSDLIFSSVSMKRLYSLVYRLDNDKWSANDITMYGEHLVAEAGGIREVVVTREPHPILWCRTAIGTIITLTYDSTQEIAAWSRITLDGTVTKILSVPDDTGNDQVWINIERDEGPSLECFDWNLQTDSAVTGTDAEGETTWGGLAHLEGKEVVAVADGFVVQGLVVSANQVELPFPAKVVEIGLNFTGRIKDLPFGVNGAGASISQPASLNKIKVLLYKTKGCKVDGERIPFRKFGDDLLDKPVPAFTGWKTVGTLGWGDDGSGGQVEIIRDLPLPCTVLAIVKEITING